MRPDLRNKAQLFRIAGVEYVEHVGHVERVRGIERRGAVARLGRFAALGVMLALCAELAGCGLAAAPCRVASAGLKIVPVVGHVAAAPTDACADVIDP